MSRMPWTSPRLVVPVVLAAAALAAVSGRRTWLSGQVTDAVLGHAQVTGPGTRVVPGLVAIALIIVAGVLAAATSGPRARRLCLAATALAALALAALAIRAIVRAATLLGTIAAESTSRSGTIPVTGIQVGPWAYLVAAAGAIAALAAVAGLVGAGRWRGLSQRYDAPAGEATGSRGERTAGAWDDLDRDIDPTER